MCENAKSDDAQRLELLQEYHNAFDARDLRAADRAAFRYRRAYRAYWHIARDRQELAEVATERAEQLTLLGQFEKAADARTIAAALTSGGRGREP